jgi:hypothetical protein
MMADAPWQVSLLWASPEGTTGVEPVQTRPEHTNSWEVEKALFTKNIFKIHRRNNLQCRCVPPCHSSLGSESRRKPNSLEAAPEQTGRGLPRV